MSWRAEDRRAATAGGVVLVVLAIAYPVVADELGRPLAAFVLPGLLTAVLGGWRPTLVIGFSSLAVAVVEGVSGPLDTEALLARWAIIIFGLGMGAVGAAIREAQHTELAELEQSMAMRESFLRALAPAPQPPPGMVAVASYRPAEESLTVGGDFLEAITLKDGRLAVLMGDVCGHGPREAAFGAALRAGWKSIALSTDPDPEEWVRALDAAFFRDGRFDSYATLCTGYLDPGTTMARLVNAGHVPPLALRPDRAPQPLELRVTRPLGIDPEVSPRATDLSWSGEAILFFTDGLIENPMKEGGSRRWFMEGLTDWLDAHWPNDPHALVDQLAVAATADREIRDDVAILLVAQDTG